MSKPIVAVVGRPNVGKSTLFNKLCGQRLAIVEDTPGITRDRIFANCEWSGHEFMLVDTGGIEPKATEGILAHMREQAEIAIDTADCIIMVVDVRDGLTAADEEVAHMLRRSHKPIILAVNKCDKTGEAPMELYEFYNLGFDEVLPISSVHGHGTGDLLDAVCAHLDFSETVVEEDRIPVAIIGRPNAGKSSLLNALAGYERAIVTDIPGTTRDTVEEKAAVGGVLLRLIDTAGIRATDDRLEQMGIQRTMSSIERAQIVIYMTDAARLAAGAPVAPEFPLRADQKLLVLVNKTDTAPDCPLPEGTIGISARNGDGIESLRRILRSFVDTEALYHGDAIVSNNRHYEALTAAGDALRRALDGLNNSLQTDLLSEEIRQVIHHVGSVTGRNSLASEEVLKHIFSKHCVGK